MGRLSQAGREPTGLLPRRRWVRASGPLTHDKDPHTASSRALRQRRFEAWMYHASRTRDRKTQTVWQLAPAPSGSIHGQATMFLDT